MLVLEDYHVIQSTEITAGISFLLQHLPESLHLLFITRTEPELPLALLRVRDELVEIHTSDLRFNEEEARDFLQRTIGTDLSSSSISKLIQKTEGWPAGLRLVALALQNKSAPADVDQLIESFSGSDRYVADYLINEVFERQPDAIQSFLLRTVFLQPLTGSLADAILETDNSAAILEQLERENLFLVQLERGGHQVWYRYNPLFAESIQSLARKRFDAGIIQSIFEKASGWYESQGLREEAIETALSARLFERATALIEDYIEIHELHELNTLYRWLENIPQAGNSETSADLFYLCTNPVICR